MAKDLREDTTPWWQYVVMWVCIIAGASMCTGCEAEEQGSNEVPIPCDMRVKTFFWPEHFKLSVELAPMDSGYHPTVHTLLDIHIDQNVVGVEPRQILVREWRCKDGAPKAPYVGIPPTAEEMNRKALQPPIPDPAAY